MEPFEDEKLVAALESLRPEPRPDFAAELDQRAVAGFPRRSRLGAVADRIRALEPRRALIPAGATALAAIAAVTVVVAVNEGGNSHPTSLNSVVERAAAPPRSGLHNFDGAGQPQNRGGNSSFGPVIPSDSASPKVMESGAASAGSASATAAPGHTGPYASEAPRREIERSAQITLGTDPENVRKAAAEVFTTIHAYRGIVLNSSIRDGAAGEAGARFELLIPSAKLGDAMADFSAIAEVRSRHEATADITAPTVRTGEQLRDSQAKIESLLGQLADADTEAERVAAETELRAARRHAAYLRSQLSNLERRANLSRVSLQIETGEAGSSSDGSGGWDVGNALDDAGEILAIAAGVTIIALAILGPIALIALLAWLAHRTYVRRSRQRALT